MSKKETKEWIGYGILNAYGNPWTHKVFETVGEAERYMELFWDGIDNPPDMSKHEVVKLKIRV